MAKLNHGVPWAGRWDVRSNFWRRLWNRSQDLSLSCWKEEKVTIWVIMKMKEKMDMEVSLSSEKRGKEGPSPNWTVQVSEGVRAAVLLTLRWTFSCSPWLKRRSAQRWGQGQSRDPCGGHTGPGRTVVSIIDVGRSIKGRSTPLWGRGTSCVFFTVMKREELTTQPQDFSPLFPTWSCPLFSLSALPLLIPEKPYIFPLFCCMGIFTMGFLCCVSHWPKHCCIKREVNWGDPISTDKLWGELRRPIFRLMKKSLPSLSLGGRCYSKKSGVRVLLAPENSEHCCEPLNSVSLNSFPQFQSR